MESILLPQRTGPSSRPRPSSSGDACFHLILFVTTLGVRTSTPNPGGRLAAVQVPSRPVIRTGYECDEVCIAGLYSYSQNPVQSTTGQRVIRKLPRPIPQKQRSSPQYGTTHCRTVSCTFHQTFSFSPLAPIDGICAPSLVDTRKNLSKFHCGMLNFLFCTC